MGTAAFMMNCSSLPEKLKLLVEESSRRTGIPGVAVEVSLAGERVQASAGTAASDSGIPINSSSRFTIGCITKMLTSIVALELVERRRIDPGAPLDEYVPELSQPTQKRPITVGHLGSHTSGYQGITPARVEYAYYYSWEKFAEYFPRARQVFSPGSMFNYEHTEGVILGEVIRRVSGVPVQTLTREMLLDPLGLDAGDSSRDAREPHRQVVDHAFDPAHRRYQRMRALPYCGFWSASLADMSISVHDLVTVAELLVRSRELPGISPTTLAALRRQLIALPVMSGGPESEAMPVSFGFGCAQYGPSLFGHNGSGRGQTCALRFDPVRRLAFAVGLNAWEPRERDFLTQSVLQAVCPDAAGEDRTAAAADRPQPGELEGDYIGCLEGVGLHISSAGKNYHLDIVGAAGQGKRALRLVVALDDAGRLYLKSDGRLLSIGFLRDEESGDPCVMVGMSAFRKT